MVKDPEQLKREREAQRAALKKRMREGRLDQKNLPPSQPLPELPISAVGASFEVLKVQPNDTEQDEDDASSVDMEHLSARPKLSERKKSLAEDGSDSDTSLTLKELSHNVSFAMEDSDLDLEESLDSAAERSGMLSLSDVEEGSPILSITKLPASSATDLLATSANGHNGVMPSFTSSDEEDFDLSLDHDHHLNSRLSTNSTPSTRSSVISNPSTSLKSPRLSGISDRKFATPNIRNAKLSLGPKHSTSRLSLPSLTSKWRISTTSEDNNESKPSIAQRKPSTPSLRKRTSLPIASSSRLPTSPVSFSKRHPSTAPGSTVKHETRSSRSNSVTSDASSRSYTSSNADSKSVKPLQTASQRPPAAAGEGRRTSASSRNRNPVRATDFPSPPPSLISRLKQPNAVARTSTSFLPQRAPPTKTCKT